MVAAGSEVTPKPSWFFRSFGQEIALNFAVKLFAQQSFSVLWTEDVGRFFSIERRRSLLLRAKMGVYAARRTATGLIRLGFAAACGPSLAALERLYTLMGGRWGWKFCWILR